VFGASRSGARPRDSRRQVRDERGAGVDPALQFRIVGETRRVDEHIALHRSAGEIHRTNMRTPKRVGMAVRADARHQCVTGNADGHVSLQHEGDAAEHLLLDHVVSIPKQFSDPFGEPGVVGHQLSCVRGGCIDAAA
jgi:hypothetical protein